MGSGNPATYQSNTLRKNYSGYLNYWYGNDIGAATSYAANQTVAVTYDQTTRYLLVRSGASQTFAGVSQSSSGRASLSTGNMIGSSPYSEFLNGDLYSAYIFNTALTAAQLDAVYSRLTTPP